MSVKIISLFIILFISTISLAEDIKTKSENAIENTADLQVLSQEVAKVYLSLVNNIREPKFYQQRDAVIENFDEHMHQLGYFVPTEEIKTNIQKVRALWKDFKAIANWTINKEGASKLLKLSAEILESTKLLNTAYREFEIKQRKVKLHKTELRISESLIQNNNLSIVIQRVLLYYLAEKQGIDATNSGHKLDDAQKLFTAVINKLEKSRVTSSSIKNKIQKIKKAWDGISLHLVFVDKDQSYVPDMLNRGLIISETIREIKKTYKTLLKKLSISDAINDATAQGMQCQKVAKSYLASLNNHLTDEYQKEVLEHIRLFEEKHNFMWETSHNEDIKMAITEIGPLWKSFKTLVTDYETKDEEKIKKVIEKCEKVMDACEKVTVAIENYASKIHSYKALSYKNGVKVSPTLDITHQIHLSSHLRIYSQRVALYFLMKVMEYDKEESIRHLKQCVKDFEPGFEELKKSRLNSTSMSKLLESCIVEWDWISKATEMGQRSDIDMMLEHSDMLSRKLMKMTNMYEHKMNVLFSDDEREENLDALLPSKN